MKTEELIRMNLEQKLGIWIATGNDDPRLLEHIRMLDWVLSDCPNTRILTEILDAWGAWPKGAE